MKDDQKADSLLKKVKTVGIIDSGNTAMDVARIVRKRGVKAVVIDFREKPRALEKEIQAAKKDKVIFLMNSVPLRFISDSQTRVKGIILKKKGKISKISVDLVVYTIGTKPSFDYPGISKDKEGYIKVNLANMETSLPGIFAGGDIVLRKDVPTAISHGQRAAKGIHRYLSQI
jgi:glutamate synthase (NADPH/NADH) small chain